MSYYKKQQDKGIKDHIRAHEMASCQSMRELQERGFVADNTDWNTRDNDSNTLLILAAQAGNMPLVRLLLQKDKADVTLMNHQKQTAVMVATDPQIRNLIREHYSKAKMPISVKHFAEIDPEYTKNMCLQWVMQGKERNVITGKKIEKRKAVYNNWVQVCKALDVDVTSPARSPDVRTPSDDLDDVEMELVIRISRLGLNEKLNPAMEFAIRKCSNIENPITFEEFGEDENDFNEIFSIRMPLSSGKFMRKGSCMLRSDFRDWVQSDVSSVRASPMNPEAYVPSSIFMSEWVQNPISRITLNDPGNVTGHGGMPGHRIFVKIPPQTFITLKSLYRIYNEPQVKEWFALPLNDGEPMRLGNMFGKFLISSSHGQYPGFTVYKLYPKEELPKNMRASIDIDEFVIHKPSIDRKLSKDLNAKFDEDMVIPTLKAISSRILQK